MIKVFLLALDLILIAMFLFGSWNGAKENDKMTVLFAGGVALILTLNSLFILNS